MFVGEQKALIILHNTPHLGPLRIRLLVKRLGSAEAVLAASVKELAACEGIGSLLAEAVASWSNNDRWQRDLDLIAAHGVEIVTYRDPTFPKPLEAIIDAPVLLYVRGSIKRQDTHAIAIVGTRNASHYGTEEAYAIASDLARMGYTITSGLARGVDTHAHVGALAHGRTVAVIGSGLANLYPRENLPLAKKIAACGAVISEFPMATPPDKQNFPQRNRIVSALSKGILLVEAPAKSGAMITMVRGEHQGKRLFALPGRVDMPSFRGNHSLIKEGRAQLVESAEDIAAEFETLFPLSKGYTQPRPTLSVQEEELIRSMPSTEAYIEEIVTLSSMPISTVSALLMGLVLKKVVKEFPGKIYKKKTY
ncbi:DNA-processing protein DprA [Simkania negevensis]|uniref:DNA-processing protein DprA n=1 Tax=Simkania negevensis TaxID=83561 RepID=A0ABS3ARL7_9BACT|nr:DNA-processing protein DprA [Simkania negevensis]